MNERLSAPTITTIFSLVTKQTHSTGRDRNQGRKNQAHADHARWCPGNRTDPCVHRSVVHVCREEIGRAPRVVYSRISHGQGTHSGRRMGRHGSPLGGKRTKENEDETETVFSRNESSCGLVGYEFTNCLSRTVIVLPIVFRFVDAFCCRLTPDESFHPFVPARTASFFFSYSISTPNPISTSRPKTTRCC